MAELVSYRRDDGAARPHGNSDSLRFVVDTPIIDEDDLSITISNEKDEDDEEDEVLSLLSGNVTSNEKTKRAKTKKNNLSKEKRAEKLRELFMMGSIDSYRKEPEGDSLGAQLNPDSNAFMITARFWSIPFFTSILISNIKFVVLALIVASKIEFSSTSNPLQIPASIEAPVAIGQIFALIIAICTQDDLIASLKLFDEGYSSAMGNAFEGATFFRWILAAYFQLFQGSFSLIVTFFLIVTSSDNVDLLLNFTAVEFVSLLDNVAFSLAGQGLLGPKNQAEADLVSETVYRYPPDHTGSSRTQVVVLTAYFILMLSGWAGVYVLQLNGYFTAQTIYVQFDDTLRFELGSYSGVYKFRPELDLLGLRKSRYYAEKGKGQFGYCRSIRAWTFKYEEGPPCEDYVVKSTRVSSNDMVEAGNDIWYVTKSSQGDNRFFPMDNFHLSIGCIRDADCGGEGKGLCQDAQCVCEDKFFGATCAFSRQELCESIFVDEQTGTFGGSREFSLLYNILRDPRDNSVVLVYDHPVYIFDYSLVDSTAGFDVMMYTGARWVLFYSEDGFKGVDPDDVAALADHLTEDFRAINSIARIEFISEVVSLTAPSNTPAPIRLKWYLTRNQDMRDVVIASATDTALLCKLCNNETNPCLNGNVCQANGECDCVNGATGTLCQITPLGNGRCDLTYNKASFGYDGGDCCTATCESSEDFTCGVVPIGQLEAVNIGFPDCVDPDNSCSSTFACWAQNSAPIPLLFPGSAAHLTMAANGLTILVAEPDLDVVRVFDKRDSQWIQRGPVLEGARDSQFGRVLAISTLPGEVVGRRFGVLPLIVAVAMRRQNDKDGGSYAAVRVARWDANSIDWSYLGDDFEVCRADAGRSCDITSLSIVQVQEEVMMSVLLDDGDLFVFKSILSETGATPWEKAGTISGLNSTVSTMSRDGSRLVVDTMVSGTVGLRIFDRIDNQYGETWDNATEVNGFLTDDDVAKNYTFSQFYTENSQYNVTSDPTSIVAMNFMSTDLLKVFVRGSGDDAYLMQVRFFDSVVFALDLPFAYPEVPKTVQEAGLHPMKFSDSSFVFRVQEFGKENEIITVFTEPFEYGGFFAQNGDELDLSEKVTDQAVSYNGGVVAVATEKQVQVYGNIPTCPVGTVLYRILITLDEFPAEISWALESYQKLFGKTFTNKILEQCDGCYDDNNRFSRGYVIEEICVPEDLTECTLLRFNSKTGLSYGAGFVVLKDGQQVGMYEGTGEIEDVMVKLSEAESCILPDRQPFCPDGSAAFTAVISFDQFPDDMKWSLLDTDGVVLLYFEDYVKKIGSEELQDRFSTSLDGSIKQSTVLQQACVPDDECFTLTIHDGFGDGFCCVYGNGEISILLDGNEVSHYRGDQVSRLRRDRFGPRCEALDLINITLEMQFDMFPSDTGYEILQVADGEGNRMYNPVHIVTDSLHFFVSQYHKSVETIEVDRGATFDFIITDYTGDGLIEGYYAVYLGEKVDGEKLLLFGDGEFSSYKKESFVASEDAIIEFPETASKGSETTVGLDGGDNSEVESSDGHNIFGSGSP